MANPDEKEYLLIESDRDSVTLDEILKEYQLASDRIQADTSLTWAQRREALLVLEKISAQLIDHIDEDLEASVPQSQVLSWQKKISIMAIDILGSDKANLWLNRPNNIIQGRKPIDLARSKAGAKEVEVLLQRIAHGAGT